MAQRFFFVFAFCVTAFLNPASAQDAGEFDASGDYIKDCKYATCVGLAALRWSKDHPFGVAIAVRLGTKPAVTDDQIKMVLTQDFAHYGVNEVKFFYENHDAIASVMTLHVRGGTEGGFVISDVRQAVQGVAERAKNKNPATIRGR